MPRPALIAPALIAGPWLAAVLPAPAPAPAQDEAALCRSLAERFAQHAALLNAFELGILRNCVQRVLDARLSGAPLPAWAAPTPAGGAAAPEPHGHDHGPAFATPGAQPK